MFYLLYTLIIYPLIQIIEVVYVLFDKIFGGPVISIAGVSIAVTFLCLPLYVVAEKWQETERNTVKRLKPKIDKIRAAFRGDEQYMVLSTYYKQNHYHPVYALRNSLGILIQIPFFIAAYTYLSHLEPLNGVSFLFIKDLGIPDAVWSIGAFNINILPVIMTLINCISGAIYTKGFPVKDKIQVYGVALFFLVLLYNSPAGLVYYWILNNIFSLIKNIFYKLKNPLKVLYIIISFCVSGFIVYILFFNTNILEKRLLLVCAGALVLFIPLYIRGIKYIFHFFLMPLFNEHKQRNMLFITSCILITILSGLSIPAEVIASSPDEFSFIAPYTSPAPFIFHSFFSALGLFFFWPLCIFCLFNDKIKTLLVAFFSWAAVIAMMNTFIFQGNYGMILNTFNFDIIGALSFPEIIKNTISILCIPVIIFVILLFLKRNKISVITSGIGILLLSLTAFSFYNTSRIYSGYKKVLMLQETTRAVHAINPVFTLARDKPNIIIFMSDCAINGLVQPIFREHPRLNEQFDGFTLYPNTLSFATHTLMGVPPVWGGYEYTPKEMNKRETVPMVEKHNEALLVLPLLLSGAGYQVTVTDPSWANYSWTSDISIYDKYENIKAINTIGRYNEIWYKQHHFGNGNITSKKIERNILWFSLLKIAPPPARPLIYDDGWYWSPDDLSGSNVGFINSYAVLDYLPELTVYNAKEPSALLITNEATHDRALLQYPDYIPVEKVTDTGDGEFSETTYYHANSAFYLKFGEWLEELKKNNVYDNTRIIIVSDHGGNFNAKLTDTDIPVPGGRREEYNPVLLVKDFNKHGYLRTDMIFMTNADIPVLATRNIITNPVNPFTGSPITTDLKKDGVYITTSHLMQPMQHNKKTLRIKNDQWVFVHDNILDANNWRKVEP
ncbi:membrane protein [Spirochaetia bacterium]|nr:membrane protein [Spirochaetia bacterium]